MRLYRVNIGTGYVWYGTQDDAKTGARSFNKPFEQVEVPTVKEALLGWLNQHIVIEGMPLESDVPETKAADYVCPNCKRSNAEAKKIAALVEQGAILAVLEDHILKGDLTLVGGLIATTLDRLKELQKGLK